MALRSSDICSHVGLLGELDLSNSLSAGHHVLVLDTHDTTTPLSAESFVVVELLSEGLAEGLEVLEVLLVHLSEGNAGSGLGVHELAEVGLAADEGERNTLLSAESGQMDHDLDGVDIVGNHDELGLVLLNEGGDVVKTELDVHGLGGLGSTLILSSLLKSVLLLLSSLGGVLGKQFKELGSCINYNQLEYKFRAGTRCQPAHCVTYQHSFQESGRTG